jgi:hypothetical protein
MLNLEFHNNNNNLESFPHLPVVPLEFLHEFQFAFQSAVQS